MSVSRFFATLLQVAVIAGTANAADVQIVDGDTLDIDGTRYRINGIDAPEHGQKCGKAGSGTWACGKAATEKLREVTASGSVRCEGSASDDYGRIIADCYTGSLNIGAEMVRAGYAWAFVRFTDIYAGEEEEARSARRGVWQGQSQPAWEYRAARWAAGDEAAPPGCPIKGNISDRGLIYHAPWSPWYSRTRINTAKGERWFCDEGEALAAGWRAPLWGR